MTTLPAERDLPPAARDAARARVVAAVRHQPIRSRPWVPLAAAAALTAVVAGAVVAGDRWSAGGRAPAAPRTGAASVSPTPPPPTAADRERCGVAGSDKYITGYRDAEAVTWLFLRAPAKETAICTTLAGPGTTANFMNDWFLDGLAPARDGELSATVDAMGALGPDWQVLVGAVPAAARKVVVKGPEGERQASIAASWYVYHFHDRPGTRVVQAYDAAGRVIATARLSS